VTDEKSYDGSETVAYDKVGLGWLPRMVRGRLTPAAFGSAVTALCIAIWYVVSAQHDLRTAQRDIHQLHDTVGELQKQSDMLHDITTQLAVMAAKLDDVANEVDRQRDEAANQRTWRENIQSEAETPPHAKRHHR
jgi:cell division protein FtsL